MTHTPTRWSDGTGTGTGTPYPQDHSPAGPQYAQPEQHFPYGYTTPPPPPEQGPGRNGERRPRRRPGWAALVLATATSAVLASGLTVGAVQLLDEPATPAATSSSAPASSGDNATAPLTADGAVDWTSVAATVSPSVVSIKVSGNGVSGSGSGVVLDTQGHILTNNHVATAGGSGETLQVTLSDGRVFDDVRVVGLDAATDLAVLQLENAPDDLTPATFGDSSEVVAGQPVMAVGNPLGLNDSVTTGIVSAVDRPVTTAATSTDEQQQGQQTPQSPFGGGGLGQQPQTQTQTSTDQVVTNAIQTDAAVNPGNSGGALVDATGSVIGIPSSIATTSSDSDSSGSIGLGFAIPANEAKRIADELIATGTASHSWLGVSSGDGTATAEGVTRQGATIAQVVEGAPAAAAGLRAGDVVVSVDGEVVTGAESLTAQIRERAPGDTVTLGIVRDGAAQNVSVTLAAKGD